MTFHSVETPFSTLSRAEGTRMRSLGGVESDKQKAGLTERAQGGRNRMLQRARREEVPTNLENQPTHDGPVQLGHGRRSVTAGCRLRHGTLLASH